MHAALRLGFGHALDAMDATLVLQLRIGAVAMDFEHYLVVAAFLAMRDVHHLHLPALALGPFRVHAEEVGCKQRRLLPTLSALYLDDDVPVVIGILGQEQHLEPLLE